MLDRLTHALLPRSGALVHGALVLLLVCVAATAAETAPETCSLNKWRPEPERLKQIVSTHESWVKAGMPADRGASGRAVLCNAQLDGAVLSGRNLRNANLEGANLKYANLSGAVLTGSRLSGANADFANLSGAFLETAHLEGTSLRSADLTGAHLQEANLDDADLKDSTLNRAELIDTVIAGARLSGASLAHAIYTPKMEPSRAFLEGLRELDTVVFNKGQQTALVLLRNLLYDAGLRDLARDATLALERGLARHAGGPELWLKTVLFDWTAGYGRNYVRPLIIVGCAILMFALLYLIPIVIPQKSAGIYRVFPRECLVVTGDRVDLAQTARAERVSAKDLSALRAAMVFSLHTTFYLGLREVAAGSWIARLLPVEQGFRSLGWVRVVSGLQAVVTFYLISLAVLSYFGRPFGF